MIHLCCNNREVSLPDDFQFTLTQDNPFFLRSGSYTYDLEISLIDTNNAKIFKNIHRINNTKEWQRVTAKLYDNGVCLLDGTCIILDVSDCVAKIQLIGDVCELNNILNDETLISELDMGIISADEITRAKINYITMNNEWRMQKFCLPMIRMKKNKTDDAISDYIWLNEADFQDESYEPGQIPQKNIFPVYDKTTGYISLNRTMPMPYLFDYAKRLLKVLGYDVEYSFSDTMDEQYLFFVNQARTLEWAKMLPGWTVKEFFEELEKFFNCVIWINAYDKVAKIMHFKEIEIYDREISMTRVGEWKKLKSFSKEYVEENMLEKNTHNAKYALPSSLDSYKYMSTEEAILKEYGYVDMTINNMDRKMATDVGKAELQNYNKIFRCSDYDNRIMFINELNRLREINRFGEYRTNYVDDQVDFKIVPAAQTTYSLTCYFPSSESIELEDFPAKPWKAIADGIKDEKKLDSIAIAYQDNLAKYNLTNKHSTHDYQTCLYAQACIDYEYVIAEYIGTEYRKWIRAEGIKSSLSLNATNGIIQRFHKSLTANFETTTEYTTDVEVNSMIDIRSKINIDSMQFNILSIEYIFTKSGLSNTAKIKLVRIKGCPLIEHQTDLN